MTVLERLWMFKKNPSKHLWMLITHPLMLQTNDYGKQDMCEESFNPDF